MNSFREILNDEQLTEASRDSEIIDLNQGAKAGDVIKIPGKGDTTSVTRGSIISVTSDELTTLKDSGIYVLNKKAGVKSFKLDLKALKSALKYFR